MSKRKRFGEILIEAGALTEETLQKALIRQRGTGRRLGLILEEMGVISEREIALGVARQFHLKTVSNIAKHLFPFEVLALIDGLGGRGVASVLRERPDELIAMGALAARGSEVDITPSIELVAAAVMLEPRRAATVRVADDSGAVEEQAGRGGFRLPPTSGPVEVRTGQLRATTAPLALGVVIDARGRPLTLPPRDAERLPTLARWLRALAAVPEEQP